MAKAKRKKPKSYTPQSEFWGAWEDKSHLLKFHPDPAMTRAYGNLVISVQVSEAETEWGTVTHLWVRRHDGRPLHWKHMQRIKNELVGEERTAVEVYPAQADLVDVANMYHLYVLPEGYQLPFGLHLDN